MILEAGYILCLTGALTYAAWREYEPVQIPPTLRFACDLIPAALMLGLNHLNPKNKAETFLWEQTRLSLYRGDATADRLKPVIQMLREAQKMVSSHRRIHDLITGHTALFNGLCLLGRALLPSGVPGQDLALSLALLANLCHLHSVWIYNPRSWFWQKGDFSFEGQNAIAGLLREGDMYGAAPRPLILSIELEALQRREEDEADRYGQWLPVQELLWFSLIGILLMGPGLMSLI